MKSGKYYWEQKFEETKTLFEQRPEWMKDYDNDIPSAAFIKGLIAEYKPENILEIGAAAGWSAYYILEEALRHCDAGLTSVDIDTKLYYAPEKKIGSAFDENNPYFYDKWNLVTKKCSLEYLADCSDKKYDFVFIDASHFHPWAALDFLAVLPFLKEKAVVAFHDVFLNNISLGLRSSFWHPDSCVTAADSNRGPYVLYKFLEDEMTLSYDEHSPNIAALEFSSQKIDKYLRKILYSLKLPWEKIIISQQDTMRFYSLLIRYVNFIEKYFSCEWAEKFSDVIFSSFKDFADSLSSNSEFEKILRRLELLYIAKPESRIIFWGASVFLESFIQKSNLDNYNIIGVIDRNLSKKGQKISGYDIYQPEDIKELKPEVIISSVVNHKDINKYIRSYLKSVDYDCMVL